MEMILNFLVDNYLWFLIISLILIFGLIGYIVDTNEKKTPNLHFGNEEDINDENNSEPATLQELIEENDSNLETEKIVDAVTVNNSEEISNINEPIINDLEEKENELPNE